MAGSEAKQATRRACSCRCIARRQPQGRLSASVKQRLKNSSTLSPSPRPPKLTSPPSPPLCPSSAYHFRTTRSALPAHDRSPTSSCLRPLSILCLSSDDPLSLPR
eukprot:scaffold434_cov186-Pinguiococcus_pyrenoidosus.AAC.16